jgi:hypothetical protein
MFLFRGSAGAGGLYSRSPSHIRKVKKLRARNIYINRKITDAMGEDSLMEGSVCPVSDPRQAARIISFSS